MTCARFRLLPVEATEAMTEAMARVRCADFDADYFDDEERNEVRAWVRDEWAGALSAAPVLAEATGWQPMATAPKDGTKIDVWCARPGLLRGVRFTDVAWRAHDGTWGWIMHRPDKPVEWVILEHGNDVYPPWIPTHWMPIPDPPALNASLAIAAGQLGEKESGE